MQTCSSSVIVHANHEGKPEVSETEDVNTFERPRIRGSREMATEATRGILRMVSESDERCNELAQVVVECNEVNVEANGARGREIHEDLSYKEMMERWEFLKHLPHQYVYSFKTYTLNLKSFQDGDPFTFLRGLDKFFSEGAISGH